MYIRKRRLGFKGVLYILLCLVIIAAAAAGIFMYMNGMFNFSDDDTVECTDHEWKTINTKNATCLAEGSKQYRCKLCSEEKTEVLSALGHETQTIQAKAATCTSEGKTEGTECKRCETVITPSVELDMLPHQLVTTYPEPVLPTCTSNGYVGGVHCSVCKTTVTPPQQTPALNHEYVPAENVAPTCASDGYEGGVWCKHCHKYNEPPTVVIPAITDRHTGTIVPDKDGEGNILKANCSEDVYGECDVCGERLVIEAKSSDKHDWVMISEEELPDCKTGTDGHTAAYECSVCKIAIGGDVISHELCHDPDSEYCTLKQRDSYIIEPDEDTAGRVVVECTGNCGLTYETDVPPLGSGDFNEDNNIYPDDMVGKSDDEE